jgi:hypothetical protein
VVDTLSRRALNRATLARQLLLARATLPAIEAVEHLVGMQAQAPFPPYFGLWTRLAGFRPGELAALLIDRKVVRIVLMRGTVHLVTADDCLAFRPVVQPIMDRDLRTNTTYAPGLAGLDLDDVAVAGRALLEKEPLTGKELGRLLTEQWRDADPLAMAHALRGLLPLVQVPPRAVWGKSGQPTYATAERWLGRPLAATTPDAMILRYLGAFGPATVRDAQTWSGLSGWGEAFERLRPQLRVFRDDDGRELFDLPDAERPDPDVPAPPRFLPEYDNVLLSHADRRRVVSDEHRKAMATRNGVIPGSVLVDGTVAGMWRIDRRTRGITLVIEPFTQWSKQDVAAVEDEARRLLAFARPDAEHDIVFAPPGG